MFNLEKELQLWKSQLLNTSKLTKDDIDELESHIIDKIDELQNNGFTIEKAFNIALSDLGSQELLCNEYHKINYAVSIKQKVGVGILSFILLQFLFSSIEFIIFTVSAPFANTLIISSAINVPIVNELITILFGAGYVNNLSIFAMLFSSLISLLIFSLILHKKNSILFKYFELIDKYHTQKLPYFIFTGLIPLALTITSVFSPILYKNSYDINTTGYIFSALSITKSFVYISLIIIFINKLKRLNTNTDYALQALGSYIIVNTLLYTIPSLLTLLLGVLDLTTFIIALVIYYCVIISGFFSLVNNSNSLLHKAIGYLNKSNLLWVIGILILVLQLTPFLVAPIFTSIISVEKFGEISLATSYASLTTKLFLPITCCLLLLPQSIKTSMKSLIFRK